MKHDAEIRRHPAKDAVFVECPTCGPYSVSGTVFSYVDQLSDEERRAASFYVRDCKENGLTPPELASNSFDGLKDRYRTFPAAEKSRRLLLQLAKASTAPGDAVKFEPITQYIPLLRAKSEQEVKYFIDYLISSGLINEVDRERVKLTYQGWAKVEEHQTTKRGFVAMWFDPQMDEPYRVGILEGIRDAGYEAICMQGLLHNDKICDRIEVEIRNSAFVVADFTGQRGGVYFEAGFARGLGKPVIWLCRSDESDKIHFDTRQYNHIFWKDPATLRQELATRISATITPFLGGKSNEK